MSPMDGIGIHIRKDRVDEYERLFEQDELVRWREYRAVGTLLSARFHRSEFGTDQADDVVTHVIVAEVPDMTENSAHDSDPGFADFNRRADALQPQPPLGFGSDHCSQECIGIHAAINRTRFGALEPLH